MLPLHNQEWRYLLRVSYSGTFIASGPYKHRPSVHHLPTHCPITKLRALQGKTYTQTAIKSSLRAITELAHFLERWIFTFQWQDRTESCLSVTIKLSVTAILFVLNGFQANYPKYRKSLGSIGKKEHIKGSPCPAKQRKGKTHSASSYLAISDLLCCFSLQWIPARCGHKSHRNWDLKRVLGFHRLPKNPLECFPFYL